jgi:hypothetical protein
MSRQIRSVELRAFRPGESVAHTTLKDAALVGADITESAQDALDSGTIQLDTTEIGLSAPRVTSGDRLELDVRLAGESAASRFWTAIARDVSDSLEGGNISGVSIEATDFPFTVLSFRNSDGGFEGVDVGTVLDTLVADDAPEVGRSQIQTVGAEVDIEVAGRKLMDVLSQDLAPIGDATVAADGKDLVFKPLGDVGVKHPLTPSDLRAPINIQRVDDQIINRVRVDGGTDHAVDDEQLTQSATTRVTASNRLTTQIETRKSEVDRVQLFTVPDSNSTDNLTVRLQAARNGSPVAINDRESDIARRTLAPEFLEQSGFTEFQLPAHSLSPGQDPFLIAEASGATGHDVGTDGSGTPTFKAEFPFPLLARAEAGDSQAQFRRRDLRRKDDTLQTEQAVQDAAGAELRKRSEPERRVAAAAQSVRAHRVRPAEAVRLSDFPVPDVSGRYLVTERQTELTGTLLETNLTLADVDTI